MRAFRLSWIAVLLLLCAVLIGVFPLEKHSVALAHNPPEPYLKVERGGTPQPLRLAQNQPPDGQNLQTTEQQEQQDEQQQEQQDEQQQEDQQQQNQQQQQQPQGNATGLL